MPGVNRVFAVCNYNVGELLQEVLPYMMSLDCPAVSYRRYSSSNIVKHYIRTGDVDSLKIWLIVHYYL